jgi:hypothetical protein
MAVQLPPLINGKAHEYADITCNILGLPATTMRAIKYSSKQNMQNIYGPGTGVTGRVFGTIEHTASVTLLAQEIEGFQTVSATGRIQDIPEFDITVFYLDASYVPVTHILKGCRFTSNGREAASGDGAIEFEIELIIADIQWK